MLLPVVFETVTVPRKRRMLDFTDLIDDILPLKSRRLSPSPKEDRDVFAKIKIDGYSREDLKVSVEDSKLIVEGKHVEDDEKAGYFEKTFVRKILIPQDLDQETLKSDLSSDGRHLIIKASHKKPEPPKRITIPIDIKSTSPSPSCTTVSSDDGKACNCKNKDNENKATDDLSNEKSHEVVID